MKTKAFFKIWISIFLLTFSMIAQAQKPLVDGLWKIKLIKDSGKMVDMTAKETNISIDTKGKTIKAHIGCNVMSSNFEFITSDMVKPFILTTTRKSCSGHHQMLESNLTYVLENTNSVRKNGITIEFFKNNELLMVLEHQEENGKKKKK